MSLAVSSSAAPKALVPSVAAVTGALSPFAEPALRVVAGLMLVPHGSQKLFGAFGGYGVEATGQFFATKLGLPAPLALLAGLIEVFGGIALALGLLTRLAALAVVALMTVAILAVHLPAGYFWTNGGYEYPLLWGVVALYFVVRGGGRVSVDGLIGREI
jgi:putative oxidoreductase